ncbi:unnamed protein product [Acanthoscelides obtectus]|uniref:Ionotropic glutamate receptor C-terminal domain-containing protein n=1 Tax=Acanthoscelides obtectus TaxID=200917 RepID=A0A9P0PQI3_ACAOB|nr:unnamed protein product [Acanthoscelides obtectus]CAK1676001.1 Glutamate receptor ionotropic, delta-2 [Acanthoscelides obtectus]
MGLTEFLVVGLCLNSTSCENDIVTSPYMSQGNITEQSVQVLGTPSMDFRRSRLLKLTEEIKAESFRIATFQNNYLNGYVKENGSIKGTGIAFDIIKILQQKLKFNYTIVVPEDEVFLTENKKEKGAKVLLDTQQADIIAGFLPMITTKKDNVSYSRSLDTADWSILLLRPKESAQGSGLLAPFDGPVWALIVVSVLAVGPIIHILIAVGWRFAISHEEGDNSKQYSLERCMWFVYGALLKQGSTLNPKTDSARLLFATWWLFILILTAFYTANLTAFLTLSKFTLPINSASDLGRKRIPWVTNKANGIRDVITSEARADIKQRDKLITEIGRYRECPSQDDQSIVEDYVSRKSMMFVREKSVLYHVMYDDYKQKVKKGIEESKRCTFVVAKFSVFKFPRAFAYSANFKYKELFDSTIQHLVESGIIGYKLDENLPEAEICPLNLGNTERKLRNTDLLLTYLIVGGGLAIACAVFLVEMTMRLYENTKRKKRHRRPRDDRPQPIFYKNGDRNFPLITPPPSYQSLFRPPFAYNANEGKRRHINGREYWVLNAKNGATSQLVPLRTPSALLFQYSN